MKVNVLYDKYNTKIEKATILFGETPETKQSIDIEIIEKDIGAEELPNTVDVIRLTSIDNNSIEIGNEMNKDEFRIFFNVLKNLLVQMK